MKVTINYFGQLRLLAGKDFEDVQCDEQVELCRLLAEMASRYGDKFKAIVLNKNGGPAETIIISVNGKVVYKKTPCRLSDGDDVTLLTPIAGG